MALPLKPSRLEIYNEFGSNTRNGITASGEKSLDKMHEHCFGAGDHNRLDFSEKGRPNVSSISVSQTNSINFSLTANIDPGGFTSYVKFEKYFEANYTVNVPPSGATYSDLTPFLSVDSTNSTKSHSFVAEQQGTYFFRARYYNSFVSNSSDHLYKTRDTKYQVVFPAFATPDIFDPTGNLKAINGAQGYELPTSWNWNIAQYSTLPSTFQAECNYYDSLQSMWVGWETVATIASSTNLGVAASPKTVYWKISQLLIPGDQVQIRVKASAQGTFNQSAWSNILTFTP